MNTIYNPGFWNGEPAQFRVVVAIVADEPDDLKEYFKKHSPNLKRFLWFVPLLGTQRQMVEVVQGAQKFYIDNADGSGVRKVTLGLGSPTFYHASVYTSEVLHEVPKEHWQEYSKEVAQIVRDESDEAWMALDPVGYSEHKKHVESLLRAIKSAQR